MHTHNRAMFSFYQYQFYLYLQSPQRNLHVTLLGLVLGWRSIGNSWPSILALRSREELNNVRV